MRIHRFRMLGLVMAFAFLSMTLALAIGAGGTAALGATTTLTVLSGDVSVKHLDADAFVAAADGDVVAAGDTVRTGANARALITYFEGSTVTLEPNTLLVVDAAEVRGGGTIVSMTQLVGRTWHVVTKLVNRQSRYDVKTPASTASVRGTRFLVDAGALETTITTAEGKVVAAVPAAGGTVEVPVEAGMTQTQERGAPPSPARAAPSSAPSGVGAPHGVSGSTGSARSTSGARTAAILARLREARDPTWRDARATDERRGQVRQPLEPAVRTRVDRDTLTRRDASPRAAKISREDGADRGRTMRTGEDRDRDRRD